MKIFISHSSKDKDLVFSFEKLLTNYYQFKREDLFCSSLTDSLPVGEDFVEGIKKQLCKADLIILIITPYYLESKFCMMEMGAAWAYKDNIVPIVIPSVGVNALNDTPLKNIQSIKITDENALFDNFYAKKIIDNNESNRLDFTSERALRNGISEFCKEADLLIKTTYVTLEQLKINTKKSERLSNFLYVFNTIAILLSLVILNVLNHELYSGYHGSRYLLYNIEFYVINCFWLLMIFVFSYIVYLDRYNNNKKFKYYLFSLFSFYSIIQGYFVITIALAEYFTGELANIAQILFTFSVLIVSSLIIIMNNRKVIKIISKLIN